MSSKSRYIFLRSILFLEITFLLILLILLFKGWRIFIT